MIKAAVIGHPVAHSLSPLIHGHWFRAYNIAGAYEAVDVSPDMLKTRINAMLNDNYTGLNVTVPHKQAVMELCDRLDETAQAVGAVNTIVIRNGKIEGRNTDAYGFIGNLKQKFPDFDFKKAPVLVLGAGGAARAVTYGLLQEGVPEIRIANRTRENAEILAHDFPRTKIVEWSERAAAGSDISLLANTTVLGMKGQMPLDMDLSFLSGTAMVYDIVYKPLLTDLLKNAQARHLKIVTGIGMLLHQARPAFAAWTGIMPDVTKELELLISERAR